MQRQQEKFRQVSELKIMKSLHYERQCDHKNIYENNK